MSEVKVPIPTCPPLPPPPRDIEAEVEKWFATKRESAVIWARSRGLPDPENVVHRALDQAVQQYGKKPGFFDSLFGCILDRRITDELRKIYARGNTVPLEATEIPAQTDDVEPCSEDKENLLRAAVEWLCEGRLRLLHDHYVQGKSIRTLASELATTENAVKALLYRLRLEARVVLRARGMTCFADVESIGCHGSHCRRVLPPVLPRGTCQGVSKTAKRKK